MTPDKKQELEAFHAQWLRDPITQQVKQLLEAHEKALIEILANKSMDVVGCPDQQFRQIAVQLKTTKTIKQLAYDTESFLAKLSS